MKQSLLNEAIRQIIQEEERLNHAGISDLQRAGKLTEFINGHLAKVKNHILENGFENQTDEIVFFKDFKPKILGRLIYYNKMYRIELDCPVIPGNLFKAHYQKALDDLEAEFLRHSHEEFYLYYRSGKSHRDKEFFTRGGSNNKLIYNSYEFEVDTRFSTGYDFKVSKIFAYNHLVPFLWSKIAMGAGEETLSGEVFPWAGKLIWTETKAALIELLHGLQFSGSINNGRGEIVMIARFFEWAFGVELGDIHHAFHRMKSREGGPTRFIDKLRDSFMEAVSKGLK